MPAQEGFYSNKIALRRDTQLRRGDAENLAKQSLQLPNHDTCNLMIAAFGADKDVFEVANFGDNKVFIEFEQYSRLIDKKTGKNVKYRTIIFLNPAVDSKELQFFEFKFSELSMQAQTQTGAVTKPQFVCVGVANKEQQESLIRVEKAKGSKILSAEYAKTQSRPILYQAIEWAEEIKGDDFLKVENIQKFEASENGQHILIASISPENGAQQGAAKDLKSSLERNIAKRFFATQQQPANQAAAASGAENAVSNLDTKLMNRLRNLEFLHKELKEKEPLTKQYINGLNNCYVLPHGEDRILIGPNQKGQNLIYYQGKTGFYLNGEKEDVTVSKQEIEEKIAAMEEKIKEKAKKYYSDTTKRYYNIFNQIIENKQSIELGNEDGIGHFRLERSEDGKGWKFSLLKNKNQNEGVFFVIEENQFSTNAVASSSNFRYAVSYFEKFLELNKLQKSVAVADTDDEVAAAQQKSEPQQQPQQDKQKTKSADESESELCYYQLHDLMREGSTEISFPLLVCDNFSGKGYYFKFNQEKIFVGQSSPDGSFVIFSNRFFKEGSKGGKTTNLQSHETEKNDPSKLSIVKDFINQERQKIEAKKSQQVQNGAQAAAAAAANSNTASQQLTQRKLPDITTVQTTSQTETVADAASNPKRPQTPHPLPPIKRRPKIDEASLEAYIAGDCKDDAFAQAMGEELAQTLFDLGIKRVLLDFDGTLINGHLHYANQEIGEILEVIRGLDKDNFNSREALHQKLLPDFLEKVKKAFPGFKILQSFLNCLKSREMEAGIVSKSAVEDIAKMLYCSELLDIDQDKIYLMSIK